MKMKMKKKNIYEQFFRLTIKLKVTKLLNMLMMH